MGAIADAVGKVAKGVLGGIGAGGKNTQNQTTSGTTQTIFDPISGAEERARREAFDIFDDQRKIANRQQKLDFNNYADVTDSFRDLLIGTLQNNGFASPEQIAQATDYVDQTFTAPAQQQLQQFATNFMNQQSAQAAALGRQPDDLGFRQDAFSTLAREEANLAAQRGSLIQQRADELAFQRPMQQAQLGLAGSQFFNDAASRAFNNQINLLNAATTQQQLGQQVRLAGGKTIQTGNVQQVGQQNASPFQAGLGLIQGAGNVLDMVGSMGGISGVLKGASGALGRVFS